MVALLSPRGTEWDTPIDGDAFAVPAVPSAEVYDLRAKRSGTPPAERPRLRTTARLGRAGGDEMWAPRDESEAALGSNNWAVAGALTPHGGALLANDMHLDIRVPNTWYRMSLEWPDQPSRRSRGASSASRCPACRRSSSAATPTSPGALPTPTRDWSDVVLLDVDPPSATRYRTPDGWKTFESSRGNARGRRRTPASARRCGGRSGVRCCRPDYRGRHARIRWAAHSAERLATPASRRSRLPGRSTRRSTPPTALGAPGQNFVVADRDGQDRLDGVRRNPAAHRLRRPPARVVGRRHARLERLARTARSIRASRIPRADASGPPMHAWSAARRLARARRRRLRDRRAGARHSRPPDGARAVHAARHARDPARHACRLPRAVARPVAANAHATRASSGNDGRARFREIVEGELGRQRRRRLGRLPLDARLPRRGVRPGDSIRARRVLRGRPDVQLPPRAPPRGPDLEARQRPADAPARSAVPHAGRRCCSRPSIATIEQTSRAGDLSERRWSEYNAIAYRHPLSAGDPVRRAAGWTCRSRRCPATSTRRACSGASRARRCGWSSHRGARPRASCTCPPDRAAIRCRRSTRTRTRRGSRASPRRSCQGQRVHTLSLAP